MNQTAPSLNKQLINWTNKTVWDIITNGAEFLLIQNMANPAEWVWLDKSKIVARGSGTGYEIA